MTPLFELRDVKMVYGEGPRERREALDVPSLSLWPGRTYAFLGPNGAGKTTLLHILNGLLRPTQGEVRFHGRPLPWNGRGRDLRRRMTLVMQSPWLFRGTALFNVMYGLRARGVDRREAGRRAGASLDEVGLSAFAERQVRSLSGGEAQRVALARALVLDPEVLLLDEPTSNLDEESCAYVEEVLQRLSRSGGSVLLTTHRPGLAEVCKAEVLRLEGGRLPALPPPGSAGG
ncbi:MAG: energy-coupling factor ABC transporter ATP-binding protein [Nitrospinota bacterium]